MRFHRSSLLTALLVLVSMPMLHAAQTGVLTCGPTSINISYFNLGAVASPNAAPTETLTVHAALHQFSALFNVLGVQQGGCTLTHNTIAYTLSSAVLTNLNAVSGAQSTGGAGSSTYVQAIFQVAGINASAGGDGDGGGDDGGWDRISNNPNPNQVVISSGGGTPASGGWNSVINNSNPNQISIANQ